MARFDQIIDVSNEDRALAFANIEKAARHFGVNLSETNWHQLGIHPQPNRQKAAAKAAATRTVKRAEHEQSNEGASDTMTGHERKDAH